MHATRDSGLGRVRALPVVLVLALVGSPVTNAAEFHHKLDDIDDQLAADQLASFKKALAETRKVAAEIVAAEGVDAATIQLAADRVGKLEREVEWFEKNCGPAERDRLRKLTKEFEESDQKCNGWWWVAKDKPEERSAFYRLNIRDKKFQHIYMDPSEKPVEVDKYTFDYKILGVKEDDDDIILIRMRFAEEFRQDVWGDAGTFHFDRKTKRIDGMQGWIGIPRRSK